MVATNTSDRSSGAGGGLVGQVLVGRYRIVAVVSAGASTVICDAVDIESNRPVTFKLVRPELAESDEFRRDFRRRAEVGSSVLSHPNIAALLDWGEVEVGGASTVFWVVEYLGGGSLRDLLDRGRLLEPSQALVVGLEACRALDAAHQRGIAHTEVTPSKLVFGQDRRLRIVDFGMAELMGREAWSEPSQVATHVARYAAPEQALGEAVTPKADVYALALSLLEAVTGSVPFSGDSTVSTLTARLGKLLPVSADLGSLAAVLERAGRPEPEDRYTAAEFGRALVQAAERLPRPEPIPIMAAGLFDLTPITPAAPVGDVPAEDTPVEDVPVEDVPAGDTPVEDVPAGDVPAGDVPAEDVPVEDTAGDVVAVEPAPAFDFSDGESEPSPDDDLAGAGGAAVGAAVTADALAAANGDDVGSSSDETTPPTTEPEPETTSADESDPDITATTSDELVPGAEVDTAPDEADDEPLIILADVAVDSEATQDEEREEPNQFEQAAAIAATGTHTDVMPVVPTVTEPRLYDDERPARSRGTIVAVSLFVLLGLAAIALAAFLVLRTKSYEVPELAGVSRDVALNEIAGNDWEIIEESERSDEQPVPGNVIRTFPAAGAVLDEGEEFRIVVSEGPEFRSLPDVAGLTVEAATGELESLLLSAFVADEVFDEEVPAGTVVSWTVSGDTSKVAGDQVLPGTTVALTVSQGPAPRVVPDVVGQTLEAAQATAAAVQLEVTAGEEVFSDDVPVGVIVSQSAAAGSSLERGGTFSVSVSKGIDLVDLPDLTGLTYPQAEQALLDAGFTIGSLLGTTEGTFQSLSIDAEPIDGRYRRGTPVDLIFL